MKTIGLILADWKRYLEIHKKLNIFIILAIFFHNPGMLFSLMFRIERALFKSKFFLFRLAGYIIYPFYFIITYYILDIDIDPRTEIGGGLFVHNRGIIISNFAKIGKNFKILGPITIGVNLEGPAAPIIGDNCVMCTGARCIGNIRIGDNVIMGANAAVVKDAPSNTILGGVPAKIIKSNINI